MTNSTLQQDPATYTVQALPPACQARPAFPFCSVGVFSPLHYTPLLYWSTHDNHSETPMDLKLAGRVAVITGPAKGMGAAISKAFAAEGARLALIGRDTQAIDQVAEEVRGKGGEAIVVACDVTNAAQCEKAAVVTKDSYGCIDILVNV